MQAQAQPNSFRQNVPGYTVVRVFWVVQHLALSLVRGRRDGMLRRLLVKLVPHFLINLLQIGLMSGLFGFVAIFLAAGVWRFRFD